MRHLPGFKLRASLIGVALALLATACGGEGENVAADPDPTQTSEAPAEDTTPYYEGKTIEIVVGSSPGGTSDATAHAFANFLSEHIEGNPTVHVANLPGGGGILGGNEWALNRERDGTSLFLTGSSQVMALLLKNPDAEFRASEMTPIWSTNGPRVVYFAPETGIETVEDLTSPDTQLVFGTTTLTGVDLPILVAWEALGILDDMNVIFGYEGTDQRRAAYESGELNTMVQGTQTFLRSDMEKWENGELRLVYSQGVYKDGELERDPNFPDLPHIGEVYETLHGKPAEGLAWDAFLLLMGALEEGSRAIWTHKDDPPEALAAIEAGVAAMMEDEEWQTLAEEDLAPFDQFYGDDVKAWGERVANLDPETEKWLKEDFLATRFPDQS